MGKKKSAIRPLIGKHFWKQLTETQRKQVRNSPVVGVDYNDKVFITSDPMTLRKHKALRDYRWAVSKGRAD